MMSKILKSQVLLAVLVLTSLTVEAGHSGPSGRHGRDDRSVNPGRDNYNRGASPAPGKHYDQGTPVTDDKDLIAAIQNGRTVQFLIAGNLEVIQVLPDDTSGLQHQKWMVQLSNGKKVLGVYNSDMCPRVPVKQGDHITLAGMFLMTNQGPIMHWLHHDPSGQRQDGFVELNGQRYCDK